MTAMTKCCSLWRQGNTFLNHSLQKNNFCRRALKGPKEREGRNFWGNNSLLAVWGVVIYSYIVIYFQVFSAVLPDGWVQYSSASVYLAYLALVLHEPQQRSYQCKRGVVSTLHIQRLCLDSASFTSHSFLNSKSFKATLKYLMVTRTRHCLNSP